MVTRILEWLKNICIGETTTTYFPKLAWRDQSLRQQKKIHRELSLTTPCVGELQKQFTQLGIHKNCQDIRVVAVISHQGSSSQRQSWSLAPISAGCKFAKSNVRNCECIFTSRICTGKLIYCFALRSSKIQCTCPVSDRTSVVFLTKNNAKFDLSGRRSC